MEKCATITKSGLCALVLMVRFSHTLRSVFHSCTIKLPGLTKVPPTSQLISSLPPLQSGIKNKPIVLYVVLGAIGILLTIIARIFIRFKFQRKRVLNINERESDNTGNYERIMEEMEICTPPPSYSVAVMKMESGEL